MGKVPAKKQLSLSALGAGMPGMVAELASAMAQAPAVCLEAKPHVPGVRFPRVGMMADELDLFWEPATEQHRLSYADRPEAVEWGAVAIATLFMNELTGKVIVERSAKGGGFDYWIGDDDPTTPPFTGLARFEVAGMMSADKTRFAAKIAEKKKQMIPSDALAPGFVGIVEFGTPVAHIESK